MPAQAGRSEEVPGQLRPPRPPVQAFTGAGNAEDTTQRV